MVSAVSMLAMVSLLACPSARRMRGVGVLELVNNRCMVGQKKKKEDTSAVLFDEFFRRMLELQRRAAREIEGRAHCIEVALGANSNKGHAGVACSILLLNAVTNGNVRRVWTVFRLNDAETLVLTRATSAEYVVNINEL